jgi:hypothetical protein
LNLLPEKLKLMIVTIAIALLIIMAVFIVCGVIFTFFFIARGLEKIDEEAAASTWGFRIIIIPGCILLWPVLLKKWIKAAKEN